MKYYWISDTKYVASTLIVYILLFYVHYNAFASHRSPMTINIKSRGQWGYIVKFWIRLYETNEVLLDQ